MLARVINNEGTFLLALGRHDEAALAYEQAIQMHTDIGHLADAATSLLNSVELLLDRGDAEQARVRLRQAEELLGELPDSPSPLRQLYSALLQQAMAERCIRGGDPRGETTRIAACRSQSSAVHPPHEVS